MNLTKRLIAANAIAVIIPLAITVTVALAYIFLFGKLFGSEISLQNYQRLSEIRLELAAELNNIQQKPEIIEESAFQQHLQEQLASINGDVIIVKDDQIVFSSRNFSKIDVARFLETGKKNWGKDPVRLGNISYTVQLIELPFPNGSQGNIIMLAPLGPTEANLSRFLLLLGLAFLLSFIVT